MTTTDKPTTWVTSDTHFGHKNIIKYSNRPYASVAEMDEAIINNWNSVVKPEDTIYHLGDFAFARPDRINEILKRLNGIKMFAPGNHDDTLLESDACCSHFKMIRERYELKTPNGHFVLSHYAHLVWNKSHRGTMMLHGHSHGNLRYPYPMKMLDAGVDPQGYFPISLEQAYQKLKSIETHTNDHHGRGTPE